MESRPDSSPTIFCLDGINNGTSCNRDYFGFGYETAKKLRTIWLTRSASLSNFYNHNISKTPVKNPIARHKYDFLNEKNTPEFRRFTTIYGCFYLIAHPQFCVYELLTYRWRSRSPWTESRSENSTCWPRWARSNKRRKLPKRNRTWRMIPRPIRRKTTPNTRRR